jgi:hypothetical protein
VLTKVCFKCHQGLPLDGFYRKGFTGDFSAWSTLDIDLTEYPEGCELTDQEVSEFFEMCRDGLRTTNGDTAPVTITVRQLLLLLRGYLCE